MDNSLNTLLSILAVVLVIFIVIAQMRLFTISRTLQDILGELRSAKDGGSNRAEAKQGVQLGERGKLVMAVIVALAALVLFVTTMHLK